MVDTTAYVLGRRCMCSHQMAALLCVKWRHGCHLESVTSNELLSKDPTLSTNANFLEEKSCQFHHNLIWKDNKISSDMVSVLDLKQTVIAFSHEMSLCMYVVLTWVIVVMYFRYSYMIDNIVLLITGTLHQRAISELIPKCHPLGSFEQMEAIHIASSPAELYNAVLVDTPLGEYISLFVFSVWRAEDNKIFSL